MRRSFSDFFVDIQAPCGPQYLAEQLAALGLATFDLPGADPEALLRLATAYGKVASHRDSDDRGVTKISAKPLLQAPGYAGFSTAELPLHTDRSGVVEPPTLLFMLCALPSNAGGRSTFADGAELFRSLSDELPGVVRQLLTPGSAVFGGGTHPLCGSIFAQLDNERVGVRFRFDGFGFFGTPLLSCMPLFVKALNEVAFSFKLERGQGYALQNWRWLHGRTAFKGSREALRILVDVPPDSPIQRGFKSAASAFDSSIPKTDPMDFRTAKP